MPRALITGITGQDGSYLAEQLVAKGYSVHGVIRRTSSFSTQRIDHLYTDPHEMGKLQLHYGDLADGARLQQIMAEVQPDEIYHLAAQSHVRLSFDIPEYTVDSVCLGTLRMLEAMRAVCANARFYQASSSEMFGNPGNWGAAGMTERTPLCPQSPYAIAKVAAYQLACHYREAYRLHISNGILFNHTSERRGETFVSRKITRAIGRIVNGTQQHLYLGNLDAKRDWGYAPDYMDAAWRMLQQPTPDDYVIGTGIAATVYYFLERAFMAAGIPVAEMDRLVRSDARYLRPTEVHYLRADFTKAREQLGWQPTLYLEAIVARMVRHDLDLAAHEASRKR